MQSRRIQTKDLIIKVLAERPGLSAAEIQEQLAAQGVKSSKSKIYLELKNLTEQGTLLKTGTKFRLHLNWVIDLINFAQDLKQRYLEDSSLLLELPEEGGRISWKINNLCRLGDLFSHVVLSLIRSTGAKLHLSWNPHPWFHLIQTKQEVQFFRALRSFSVRMYKIIGHSTHLDRWAEQFWPAGSVVWSYAPSPFSHLQNEYFSIIGNYIVTAKISPKTVRRLEILYYDSDRPTHNRKGNKVTDEFLDPRKLSLLLDDRSPATLTIIHDPKRAAKLSRQYESYFGHLIPGDRNLS